MNIVEAIRKRILKFLGLEKLSENPNSERLTFITNDRNIIAQNLKEYKIWYLGSGDELLNFYTNQELIDNNKEPIYNRNRMNYFWGLSSIEAKIKRVHSGVPNAIVTTLVNAIGGPKVTSKDLAIQDRLDEIIFDNDMTHVLNQQQMPLTMVEGWGAFKINFDLNLCKYPIIQYYEAENVEFVYKSNVLLGVIFKDYYEYQNKNYVLIESRRIKDHSSVIEYELFRLEQNDDVTPVSLDTIPELADLQNVKIDGLNEVLAVPSKFFFDPLNQNYGRSIYAGKIDLFDDLDQILSQDSQLVRVSTPVEYYPADVLERSPNGNIKMPNIYNRQYVKKEAIPDGDGRIDGKIETTQPDLNFNAYSENARSKLDFILIGLLSPATMGIDVAKKDNAEAQREKEKVTIMTRNNIIDRETRILKKLYSLCLMIDEYINKGRITIQDYDISVSFNEFANPSLENEIQVLGEALNSNAISVKRYVEILWGDKLSDEEKAEEVAYIEDKMQQDNMGLGAFEDEQPDRANSGNEVPVVE